MAFTKGRFGTLTIAVWSDVMQLVETSSCFQEIFHMQHIQIIVETKDYPDCTLNLLDIEF